MSISNVGDSRAIVVSRVVQDGKSRLVARALSADQTPYRKDERDRIKQYVVYTVSPTVLYVFALLCIG